MEAKFKVASAQTLENGDVMVSASIVGEKNGFTSETHSGSLQIRCEKDSEAAKTLTVGAEINISVSVLASEEKTDAAPATETEVAPVAETEAPAETDAAPAEGQN